MNLLLIFLLTVPIAVSYSSFFEWTLHRFVMHQPVGRFSYPFERHTLWHHTIFKADKTFHLMNEKDKHTIPMAWWNGPILILISSLPFALASLLFHTGVIVAAAVSVIGIYYGAYEYLHWCMHLPKRRGVERTGLFFRLNGHHILHHRYMHKNFNVVLPLADLCLGTLLRRAPVRFKQAEGYMIPNLQPIA